MHMKWLLWLVIMPVSLWSSALDADQPETLDQIQRQLQMVQAEQEALQATRDALRSEQEELRQRLVSLAQTYQANEQRLLALAERLQAVRAEKDEKAAYLERRRGELGNLADAMIRFRRLPPQAWIAMPGDIHSAVRTGMVLRQLTLYLHQEAAELRQALDALFQLEQAETRASQQLQNEQRQLNATRQKVEATIAERQTLEQQLQSNLAVKQEMAAQLARRAASIGELLAGLDDTPKADRFAGITPKRKPSIRDQDMQEVDSRLELASLPDETPQRSTRETRFILPAQGRVIRRFGVPTDVPGETLQGLDVEVRSKAQVVAPADGEVVYTGLFRDYGQIVILRHQDQFHSLLAGLSEVSVVHGQRVSQGEPVAQAAHETDGRLVTTLYVELRKNAKPIDPAPWFSF